MDDELETERTQVLFCEECGCDSDAEARGWEGHLACEHDGVDDRRGLLPYVRRRGLTCALEQMESFG